MANYFTQPLGIAHIPNFLRASNAKMLRRKMLTNNTNQKGFVKYFDIQWVESEKKWYAWYFVEDTELDGGGE